MAQPVKKDIPELLKQLDDLYDKEERLLAEMDKLAILYNQLQEDKELLQMIIMHQSNMSLRRKDYNGRNTT